MNVHGDRTRILGSGELQLLQRAAGNRAVGNASVDIEAERPIPLRHSMSSLGACVAATLLMVER
jgi:hypothetical protein